MYQNITFIVNRHIIILYRTFHLRESRFFSEKSRRSIQFKIYIIRFLFLNVPNPHY